MNPILRLWDRICEAYQGKYEPENMRRLQILYWDVLLLGTACMVVLAIAYGVVNVEWVMHTVEDVPASGPTPAAALDRASLHALVQAFSDRQDAFARLESASSTEVATDPSK